MQFKFDPAEVAARYRVLKIGENDFELQAGSTNLGLRHGGAYFHLEATPLDLQWHAEEDSAPFYAARFTGTKVRIGYSGEELWSSPLVDNCFFVIDGEALRYVPLPELTVLSDEEFQAQKALLARLKGEEPSAQSQSDLPFASATIVHCPASPALGLAGTLECTVGIPHIHFDNLLAGCLSGRILSVYFHGTCGALTASFEHEVVRELIIHTEGRVDVNIHSLSFTYRV